MSNSEIYGEYSVSKTKFLNVEHGSEFIRLSIIENLPMNSLFVELLPDEAEKLAGDLLSRAKEIKAG